MITCPFDFDKISQLIEISEVKFHYWDFGLLLGY